MQCATLSRVVSDFKVTLEQTNRPPTLYSIDLVEVWLTKVGELLRQANSTCACYECKGGYHTFASLIMAFHSNFSHIHWLLVSLLDCCNSSGYMKSERCSVGRKVEPAIARPYA